MPFLKAESRCATCASRRFQKGFIRKLINGGELHRGCGRRAVGSLGRACGVGRAVWTAFEQPGLLGVRIAGWHAQQSWVDRAQVSEVGRRLRPAARRVANQWASGIFKDGILENGPYGHK